MRQLSYGDFLILLAIHLPVEIRREHIERAEEERPNDKVLVEISDYYPTIKTRSTGGYVLPNEILPSPFRERIIYEGIGTDRLWGDKTSMVEKMILNAYEHGNQSKKEKSIYLLWHKCSQGKEICIIDEGEFEFDLQERYKERRMLSNSFGKDYYVSGIDLLYSRSEEFEYFTIKNTDGAKKGTLLRIVLEKPWVSNQGVGIIERCDYIGHTLFAKPPQ